VLLRLRLFKKGVDHAFAKRYSTSATKTLDEQFAPDTGSRARDNVVPCCSHRLCGRHGLRSAWRQTDLKHTVHPDALFYVVDQQIPPKPSAISWRIERAKLGNYRTASRRFSVNSEILRVFQFYYCEKEWGLRQYAGIVVHRRTRGARDSSGPYEKRVAIGCCWLTTEARTRGEHRAEPSSMTPKDDAPMHFTFLPR